MDDFARARALVESVSRAVAFTGAGISTASGIPDFRSPGGVWSRYRPVPFPEFVSSAEARRRYWQMKREAWAQYRGARPNAAHVALARLEAAGRLAGVITQNIDGLHQAAGSRRVLEVHGTDRDVTCLSCHGRWPAGPIHERLAEGGDPPDCGECGGLLKPATISFGQALDDRVLGQAYQMALAAGLVLVLGSSLLVHPAAAIPAAAADAGAAIILVNRDPTPLDGAADVVLRGPVEEVLPALLAGLDLPEPEAWT